MLRIICLVALVLVGVNCLGEREHEREHERKEEHGRMEEKKEERSSSSPKTPFKLDEKSKEALLVEKSEEVFFKKNIEYFLKNPNLAKERECFAKAKLGESIDFVIDIAPSPSMDEVDKMVAESPIAYYLERRYRTPSRDYFGAVQLFIDSVTYGLRPEVTHSVIYDNKRKYYIRGLSLKHEALKKNEDFADKSRNLKTMWPVNTKEVLSHLSPILENNLGRMTKLALWNRDNGLPTVLYGLKRSKPIYTIVISDGASGAKIRELTDDLDRTTVIDIGNHRFVKNMSWDEMKQLNSVYTIPAPAVLAMLIDTTRFTACRFLEAIKN